MTARELPAPPAGMSRKAGPAPARGAAPVIVRTVSSRQDRHAFVRLPWAIYKHDPVWIPPLMHDVRSVMNREKHPFHEHADVEYFLAWFGTRVVGRIAAIVNHRHVEFHEEPVGFFGLFESIDDDDVARALFAAAERYVSGRGMKAIRGPVNLSTNDELYSPGVLIDGFEHPPVVMMAHTPRYYSGLIERQGYVKARDLLSYWLGGDEPPERLIRAMSHVLERSGVVVRPLELRHFDREVAKVQEVYNSAWERNWGFVPMTEAEIHYMARQLRPVVNPDLCALAELDGSPIGFALALPDFNQALRKLDGRLLPFGVLKLLWYRRKIDAARVLTLGLKQGYRNQGLGGILILHLWRENVRAGYPKGECSWILEDNWEMRRGLERIGGAVYKTYRVFEKPITE
jgi:GNAT superfamily N-acetyltransferase